MSGKIEEWPVEIQRTIINFANTKLSAANIAAAADVPRGEAQELPDANTTLDSSRRAVRLVAQTAHLADMLPDGTAIGERRTIERTLASASGNIFKNRAMNSDGSVAAWLNGPGQVEVAWDGTRWSPVASDIKERVLTPYDFGGRGDGSYDDTTALAAWAAAGSLADKSCRLHLPEGVWRTTAPLVFTSGATNFHNIRISGANGMARASRGSVIQYVGTATASHIARFLGLAGCVIEDLIFDCNSLADGVLLDIDATYGSSSGVFFNRCFFLEPREQAGGSCFAAGPVTPPGGATQTDTVSFKNCLFYITGVGLASSVNVDNWKTNQSGNTKNFSFDDCGFYGGRRGVNWENASGSLSIRGNTSFGGCGVDIVQGAGRLLVHGAESERCGKMLTQMGAFGCADIIGWEWHGGRECADDVVISASGGKVSIRNSYVSNYRGQRTITGIDTGTDVVSFVGDENGEPLDNGEAIEIRSSGNFPAIGGVAIKPGDRFTVRNFVEVSPYVPGVNTGAYSCTLETLPGGVAVNFSSAGSGTIRFVSPVKITATSTQVTGTASFESRQNFWDCANDHLPVYETLGGNDLLTAGIAISGAGSPLAIVSEDDIGGMAEVPYRLRNFSPPRAQAELQCIPARASGIVSSGIVGTGGWHIEDFVLSEQFFAASNVADRTITLPAGAHIEECYIKILEQGVYAGSTVTAFITDPVATHTACSVLGRPYPALTCDLKAAVGTVYGEDPAHLGLGLGNGITVLTDNSAGTANDTIQAMADPTNTPADADALRDDLVANLLPALRNNIADLTAKLNALLAAYRKRGFRPAGTWSDPWALTVRIITLAGNVGNGTVSNITAGRFRLSIRYTVPPRTGS